MANNPSFLPHLLGITLDSNGVAGSQIVAINRTTGDRLIAATDSNKVVVFDAANFTQGYSVNDVIEFNNVGGSVGTATITINSATGGFQEPTTAMVNATAPTVACNL
jgi:hypothetical protein